MNTTIDLNVFRAQLIADISAEDNIEVLESLRRAYRRARNRMKRERAPLPPYTMEELNARIDEFEAELEAGEWLEEEEANAKQWTVPQMEDEICAKYEVVGKKYNLPIHYVGEAFSQVYENHKEINLYADDNKHPSYEGSYLSALVHIGTMFNCDVTSSAFNGELSEETANTLKAVASNVIF